MIITKDIKLQRQYNGLQMGVVQIGVEGSKMLDKWVPVQAKIEGDDTEETLKQKLTLAAQEKIQNQTI